MSPLMPQPQAAMESLWRSLHRRGVQVWLEDGGLVVRTMNGTAVSADIHQQIRRHASALAAFLRKGRTYSRGARDGARPSLIDLARRHRRLFGVPITENYRFITGVDLSTVNPDWPDLEQYDSWLRQEEAELLPLLEEFEEREASGA